MALTAVLRRMGVSRDELLDNVMLGRHSRMRNGFWSSLGGLPWARRSEAATSNL